MGKLKPTCQDNPSTLSGLHDSSCMKIPPYLLDKNIYRTPSSKKDIPEAVRLLFPQDNVLLQVETGSMAD